MTPTERAVIHLPDEGRQIEMGSFRMTVKADSGDTAGGLSVIEADEPPGFGPPMHIHRDAGGAFYVLSGEYVMFVDDEEHICKAGAFVYIPPGVSHGFRVGRRQAASSTFTYLQRWWATSTRLLRRND